MSTTYQKDLEELIDDTERQGWQHRLTDGGHHQFFAPNGKGIVTAPSTASDHRSFANTLADLKRYGYRPPDDRATLLADRHGRGAKRLVRTYLREHAPASVTVDDLQAVLASKLPGSSRNTVHSALHALHNTGEAVRLDIGVYRWGGESMVKDETPESPEFLPAASQPLPVFDPDAIDDEKELDEALVALSKIESVVRKHREVARQLRELRRLLGVKAGGP